MENQQQQERPPRPRPNWQSVVVYTDPDSGLAVEVRQDKACPWPKFSTCVGRMKEGRDNVQLFIPIFVNRSDGSLQHQPSLILPPLLARAEAYVLEKTAEHEEARAAARAASAPQRSGPRRSNGNGRQVMRKGKTARDRDRRAARRREKESS